MNKHSGWALTITIVILILGAVLALIGNWIISLPLFIPAFMTLLLGFKTPTPEPKKVWIITLFGQMTDSLSSGLTFVVDWMNPVIDVIGYVEIPMKQTDKPFPTKKPLRFKGKKDDQGNDTFEYLEGEVSISFIPDDSSGSSLRKFVEIGRENGAIQQLDDLISASLQEIAKENDADFAESQSDDMGILLFSRLKKIDDKDIPKVANGAGSEARSLGTIENLGIKVKKLQVVLKPPQKVIDARNRLAIERAERASQKFNNDTMNQMIADRVALSANGKKDKDGKIIAPPDRVPLTYAQAQREILEEIANDNEKLTATISSGPVIVDARGGGGGR